MKFKKLRIYLVLYFVVIGFVCGRIVIGNIKEKTDKNSEFKESEHETDLDQLKLNELELPDKVYTFFLGSYPLIFEDIYLDEDYMYYIHIEIVTPINVTLMNISIWDPDGKKFHVFEHPLSYDFILFRSFDIPYGTVMSGDYTFKFDSTSYYNYNLYIRIEQGLKCLNDMVENPANIISQDGSRFYSGKSIHHIKNLETDVSYRIYIERVSAIAITENSLVTLDCIVYDPNDVPFIIYENNLLLPIGFANIFSFGTAMAGEYDIKIRIYCNVEYVNVEYLIYRDYQISEIQDVNDTKAPSSESSSSMTDDIIEKIENSIPFEWLIGIPLFIGIILGVSYIGLLKIKKRDAPNIGIKK